MLLAPLEKPAAYITFVLAVAILVWKSVGVDWIPLVGESWNSVFSTSHNPDRQFAQYPRRSEDEDFWRITYILMYGVFGTAAQYGGILVSNLSPRLLQSRHSWMFWARLYALFHTIIGCHHIMWSLNRNHGKLELWRFELPFIYELTGLTSLGLIYHCVKILLATSNTTTKSGDNNNGRNTTKIHSILSDIRSRKTVMDCCTCCTFVSFFAFLFSNILGVETTYETERMWWAMTMYPVAVIFLLGTLTMS